MWLQSKELKRWKMKLPINQWGKIISCRTKSKYFRINWRKILRRKPSNWRSRGRPGHRYRIWLSNLKTRKRD
jgi:hypothetical protein